MEDNSFVRDRGILKKNKYLDISNLSDVLIDVIYDRHYNTVYLGNGKRLWWFILYICLRFF